MPLTKDQYRTGFSKLFIRGPHKLVHNSASVGHLT